MTQVELKQVYFLNQDIVRCRERIRELRESIQPKSQKASGMPFQNTGETSDPTFDILAQIQHMEWLLEGYIQGIAIKRAEITLWINTLEDPFLRQIINYRCVELMTWEQVAMHIGASASPDACRMYFYRNVPKS